LQNSKSCTDEKQTKTGTSRIRIRNTNKGDVVATAFGADVAVFDAPDGASESGALTAHELLKKAPD